MYGSQESITQHHLDQEKPHLYLLSTHNLHYATTKVQCSFVGRPCQLVPRFVLKCMFVVNHHGILKREHGNQLARSSDETSFVAAYVNCVLKVSANELFPDQVYETKMALIYKLTVSYKC